MVLLLLISGLGTSSSRITQDVRDAESPTASQTPQTRICKLTGLLDASHACHSLESPSLYSSTLENGGQWGND